MFQGELEQIHGLFNIDFFLWSIWDISDGINDCFTLVVFSRSAPSAFSA
jgi:hypothetical protein